MSGPWDSAKSPSINPKDFAAQESRKRLINFLCKEVEVPGYCLYTLAVAYVNEEFARIQEESDKSVSDIGIENGIENGIESKVPATAEFIKTYSQSRRKTAVKIALEILANSMLTIPQISDNSGVSKRTVARYMKEFQDAGVLIREGSDTNGKWILV